MRRQRVPFVHGPARVRAAVLSMLIMVALSTTSCALLTSATPTGVAPATTVAPGTTAPPTAEGTTTSPAATPAPSETATTESPVATPEPPTATPEPPTATPQPATATPSPRPPTATLPPSTERISFAPGDTEAHVTGNLPATGKTYFVLHLAANQLADIGATVHGSPLKLQRWAPTSSRKSA